MNDKLDKLIDLLIEYSESGETMADLNLKLYGLKENDEDLVSDCCGADFNPFTQDGREVCDKCGKKCGIHWGLVGKPKAKTEEIKPDITTSEEKKNPTEVWKPRSKCCDATIHLINDEVEGDLIVCDKCGKRTKVIWRDTGDDKPWLPNPGDGYYTIHPTHNVPIRLYWGTPKPTVGELALWKLGLIFKTQEEAMAKINSLLKL